MKKQFLILLVIMILCSILSAYADNSTIKYKHLEPVFNDEDLLGNWFLSDVLEDGISIDIFSLTLTFKSDGTVQINSQGKTLEGVWNFQNGAIIAEIRKEIYLLTLNNGELQLSCKNLSLVYSREREKYRLLKDNEIETFEYQESDVKPIDIDLHTFVWECLGESEVSKRNYEMAKHCFQKAQNEAQYNSVVYTEARAYIETERYEEAYKLLESISDYEGVTELIESNSHLSRFATSVGDIIVLGHYEQDNRTDNGLEEIEWVLLAISDGKGLLLSRYGLDAKPYNMTLQDVTWEKSTLRSWLNNDFIEKAFTTDEQAALVDMGDTVESNLMDKVFLLSQDEVKRYLLAGYDLLNNPRSRMVIPTEYAIARGAFSTPNNTMRDGSKIGWWWLRTKSDRLATQAVRANQFDWFDGFDVDRDYGCVRPAIWVKLDSGII